MSRYYDPEHEPEKFFAISWLCEACGAEGNNAGWQVTKERCPKCGEQRVSRTASVLRSVKTGLISWGEDYWCDGCADSLLPGVLFPWDQDIGHAGVEKCDLCVIYQYDDDAAAALSKLLGPEYEVRSYQVGDDPKAAGAARFAVFNKGAAEPLTFDEGSTLWRKLAASEVEPTPSWRSVNRLRPHVKLANSQAAEILASGIGTVRWRDGHMATVDECPGGVIVAFDGKSIAVCTEVQLSHVLVVIGRELVGR